MRAERQRARAYAAFASEHGLSVLGGPFRGMVYPASAPRRASGLNLAARLLGSYEAELHEIIEGAIAQGYERVIDVGAGDGYYGVGLARRMSGCTVEAYDPDPSARELCRALAFENGVLDRVEIRSAATRARFARSDGVSTFVKMDCEGCELELLNPAGSPVLQAATILVELHDFVAQGTTEAILERFARSHDASLIEARPRSATRYPELGSLDEKQAEVILSERRPAGLRWALLTPR